MRMIEHAVRYYEYYEVGEMSPDRIIDDDRRIQDVIKRCDELKSFLEKRRANLAAQYNKLILDGSHTRLTIERQGDRWQNKIYYFITIEEIYSNDSFNILSNKKYEGKERHKAIAEFKKLRKEFPHWEAVNKTGKEI